MSLEEVIAAASRSWNPWDDGGEPQSAEHGYAHVANAVREWLLADPQIERGAEALYALVVKCGWAEDGCRAALSAILESPNREESA